MAKKDVPTSPDASGLPEQVAELFWEYDIHSLSWETDRDQIVSRVLTSGSWDTIKWLRSHLDDDTLRHWIEERKGDHLSPQQLRFWEIVLDLPGHLVDAWVAGRRASAWENRIFP